MGTVSRTEDRKALRQLLKKINRAWTKGRFDELKEYFHKDMVIVAPRFQARAVGREASIRSYQDFTSRASVRSFRESDIAVDLLGTTAVVAYQWEIVYGMKGKEYAESGWELLVFRRTRGRWHAAWRTILPSDD